MNFDRLSFENREIEPEILFSQIGSLTEIEGKGRGICALKKIKPGEIVEIAPVVLISLELAAHIKATPLYHYYFNWNSEFLAICLGYGSIYNHSSNPNCTYVRDFGNNTLRFVALKEIQIGEEICTNYHGNEKCKRQLYFQKHQ